MQILLLLSGLLFVFSIAPLAGVAAALSVGDLQSAEVFATIFAVYVFIAGLILLANAGRGLYITRVDLIPTSILIWFVMGLAAVPPYIMLEGHGFSVAFYEAVSSITTSGHSLVPIANMSWPMMVFRSTSAWLGGLLTIMLAIYILGRYAVGGTASSDLGLVLRHARDGRPSVRRTFIAVFVPYLLLTVFGVLALMAARLVPGDALIATLSAISTNGLMPPSSGGTLFNNRVAESILMIIMIVGAAGILNVLALRSRRIAQLNARRELIEYGVLLIVLAIIIGAQQLTHKAFAMPDVDRVFTAMFDAVATITSTGIVHDARIGLSIDVALALALALIGGCAFSTAGGIKIFRIAAMLHHSYDEVRALIFPNRVLSNDGQSVQTVERRYFGIWSTFYATILFVLLVAFLLSSSGYNLIDSLRLAIGGFTATSSLIDQSMFSTIDGRVSSLTLLLISLVSILGRIEILVFLAAIRLFVRS